MDASILSMNHAHSNSQIRKEKDPQYGKEVILHFPLYVPLLNPYNQHSLSYEKDHECAFTSIL